MKEYEYSVEPLTEEEKDQTLQQVDTSHSLNSLQGQVEQDEALVQQQETKEPKLYKMRWFQLLIFAMCMVTTIISMSTYSTSGTLLMKFYHLDANWKINMMSLVFLIFNIPMSYTVSFVLKRFGLKWCFSIFAVVTCVGSWVRLIGIQGNEVSFWLSLIGQIFIACGQPFVTQCGDLFGVYWFGNKERTVVQVVVLFSGVFGSLLAYLMGPRIMTIGSIDSDNLVVSELGVGIFLGMQGIFSTLCIIVVLLFFKSKPPTPPTLVPDQSNGESSTQMKDLTESLMDDESSTPIDETVEEKKQQPEEQKDVYPPQTVLFGLKTLLRSPSFFMLLASSSLINSVFQSIYILEQIIKENKYTAIDAGNMNIILIVFATISSIVLSIVCDKTKQFKLITLISSASACLAFLWFCILMLWEKNDVFLVLSGMAFVLIGLFTVPTLPLLSQMLVYTTYPVHPSTTLTVTSTFTTVWSIIFMVYVNVLQSVTVHAPTIILWTDFGLLIIAFLLILFWRGTFSPVLLNGK